VLPRRSAQVPNQPHRGYRDCTDYRGCKGSPPRKGYRGSRRKDCTGSWRRRGYRDCRHSPRRDCKGCMPLLHRDWPHKDCTGWPHRGYRPSQHRGCKGCRDSLPRRDWPQPLPESAELRRPRPCHRHRPRRDCTDYRGCRGSTPRKDCRDLLRRDCRDWPPHKGCRDLLRRGYTRWPHRDLPLHRGWPRRDCRGSPAFSQRRGCTGYKPPGPWERPYAL